MRHHRAASSNMLETDRPPKGVWLLGALMLLGGIGLALAAGLSSGSFLQGGFRLPASIASPAHRSAGAPNLLPMEPVILTARDVDASAFVRVALTLELADQNVAADVRARLAAVEDAVIVTAANRDTGTLRSVAGKARLREELTKAINALLPNGGVRTVYFADFLVR